MSIFICAECSRFCDADDGCEIAPASKYGRANQLLCADCSEAEGDADEQPSPQGSHPQSWTGSGGL